MGILRGIADAFRASPSQVQARTYLSEGASPALSCPHAAPVPAQPRRAPGVAGVTRLCLLWGLFSSEQARVVFTPTSLCLSLPASLTRQACWGRSGVRLGGTGVRLPGLTAFVRDRHGLSVRRAPPESQTVASQRGAAWLSRGRPCPCAALCRAPSSTPLLAELSPQPCLEPRTSDPLPTLRKASAHKHVSSPGGRAGGTPPRNPASYGPAGRRGGGGWPGRARRSTQISVFTAH